MDNICPCSESAVCTCHFQGFYLNFLSRSRDQNCIDSACPRQPKDFKSSTLFPYIHTCKVLARISELRVQKYTFGVNWVLFIPLHYIQKYGYWVSKICNRVSKRHMDTPLPKGLHTCMNLVRFPVISKV